MSHITIAIETSNASSKHLRNLSNAAKPASSNHPRHSNRRNLQIRPNAWNTASNSYSTCGTVRNPICARVPPGTLVLRTSCQGLGPRTDSEPDSQNLLDKPRSPKKINLVSQDLQTRPSKNSPEVPEPAYWNRPKLAQVPLPLPHQSRLALCRWEVSLLPRHLTAWRTHPWGCPSKPLTSTSHTQSYTANSPCLGEP